MAKVKEVSSYSGSAWSTAVPIGANATDIDMATNPSDYDSSASETSTALINTNDVKIISSDTDLTAWGKFNRFRKRVANKVGSDLLETTAQDLSGSVNELSVEKVDKFSLAYQRSGTINTGGPIDKGSFFYLNGELKQARSLIDNGAQFTDSNSTQVGTAFNFINLLIPKCTYQEITVANVTDGTTFKSRGQITLPYGKHILIPLQIWVNGQPNLVGLSSSSTSFKEINTVGVNTTPSRQIYFKELSVNSETIYVWANNTTNTGTIGVGTWILTIL